MVQHVYYTTAEPLSACSVRILPSPHPLALSLSVPALDDEYKCIDAAYARTAVKGVDGVNELKC
jgi:hypothetical protein